ncbi:hypothetical protein C9374_000025 [Naegleria lovaniensis]|uniref:Uncharacterized protein n=1 Tax=Naegleria lovaniensis TaxID=51637 RepID=A0AA88KPG1_NAELO|nr:uncharacterized protein C9374_000025 [Naegleria lovaniensis]KAG2388586.1 hypothetical protein C9374_000025 [Naegleria lovaniensis]
MTFGMSLTHHGLSRSLTSSNFKRTSLVEEPKFTLSTNQSFYPNFSFAPQFGTFRVNIRYETIPFLNNVSFSLSYLTVEKFNQVMNLNSGIFKDSDFDGDFDLFHFDQVSFVGNSYLAGSRLSILELRFPENTLLQQYRYVLRKRTPLDVAYDLTVTEFKLSTATRIYDRFLSGAQFVNIPVGMTETFYCDACVATYLDINDLGSKASYYLTTIPLSNNVTINAIFTLSNAMNSNSVNVWKTSMSVSITNSKVTYYVTSTLNAISDLYIQVTAVNCTDINGNYLPQNTCPFSFSVKPNNRRAFVSGIDAAIVVTAVVLSSVIFLALIISSIYFFYRYRMSKRFDLHEDRNGNFRDMSSFAHLAHRSSGGVNTYDESRQPHKSNDPFVRLDKLHGYSLDSSTHYIMDANVNSNARNVSNNLQNGIPIQEALQYGVDVRKQTPLTPQMMIPQVGHILTDSMIPHLDQPVLQEVEMQELSNVTQNPLLFHPSIQMKPSEQEPFPSMNDYITSGNEYFSSQTDSIVVDPQSSMTVNQETIQNKNEHQSLEHDPSDVAAAEHSNPPSTSTAISSFHENSSILNN